MTLVGESLSSDRQQKGTGGSATGRSSGSSRLRKARPSLPGLPTSRLLELSTSASSPAPGTGVTVLRAPRSDRMSSCPSALKAAVSSSSRYGPPSGATAKAVMRFEPPRSSRR
jgi:hypothetical protein